MEDAADQIWSGKHAGHSLDVVAANRPNLRSSGSSMRILVVHRGAMERQYSNIILEEVRLLHGASCRIIKVGEVSPIMECRYVSDVHLIHGAKLSIQGIPRILSLAQARFSGPNSFRLP